MNNSVDTLEIEQENTNNSIQSAQIRKNLTELILWVSKRGQIKQSGFQNNVALLFNSIPQFGLLYVAKKRSGLSEL